MTPGHVKPQEAQRLVRTIDEKLVLRAGLQGTEPADRADARRSQARPLIANREADVRRYAFGEVDLDIGLLRAVRPGRVETDLRQRDLVSDERVVGQDRCREEPFASETVSKSAARLCDDQCCRERKRRS